MFEIEMLPAREGDALWLRYGDPDAPRQILIDCGRAATFADIKARLMDLPENQRTFELFVITHVDRDHIEGALKLLADPDLGLKFKQIWFNGYDHLKGAKLEAFGAVQGEKLSAALLLRKEQWNASFDRGPVSVAADGSLPVVTLDGGMTLTVLSPDAEKLAKLVDQWQDECKAAGIQEGIEARIKEVEGLEWFGAVPDVESLTADPLAADTTLPNGTSIALLAEHDGIRVLLGADAHPDRLTASLQALLPHGGKLALNAFKLPHHGSSGNISQALLELVDCPRYLISTNGSYFKHPTPKAIARVVKYGGPGKTLYFNYENKFTQPWKNDALEAQYDYHTYFPSDGDGIYGDGTLTISL